MWVLSAVAPALDPDLVTGIGYALAVAAALVALLLVRVSGPGDDRRLPTGVTALGALAAGATLWLDVGSDVEYPGGPPLVEPAAAVLGAVLTGLGIVALGALALGWRPGTGRTARPLVGVGAAGLAVIESVAVELAVELPGQFRLPAVVLPVVVVAALVGRSRPTTTDAARHGLLAAGIAAVALLVPLGYTLTVARSGVALTGAVGIAGFLLPLAACLAGAVGGALGGAVAARRRGRPSRA